jgi:ATP-dependent helicase HepA
MEPEMGLGTVTTVEGRIVRVHFPAAACERQYARNSAPLQRVKFQPGDVIRTRSGIELTVKYTHEKDGILSYEGDGQNIPEQELNDTLSFSSPKERLLSGFFDSNGEYELRYTILKHAANILRSPVHGFQGGRIELLPHQIYVGYEISRRPLPRVLLSDVVGLGKTIEACLILHRLLLIGRISRALILVPRVLLYQWFVELYRKFNLIFRIMDEDYYSTVQRSDSDANPFLIDQLCLCAIDFLAEAPLRLQQAIEAGWNMVVVDEAHHLTEGSPAYACVETLARSTAGLLLLTATPEQLGRRSHFTRLRLLDPARFFDYDEFIKEQALYQTIARLADRLISGVKLDDRSKKTLTHYLGEEKTENMADWKNLLQDLIDRHGMGRVVVRNTRAVMSGSPQRLVHLIPLTADAGIIEELTKEFHNDQDEDNDTGTIDLVQDPRVLWLVQMLREYSKEKVLLIGCTTSKIKAIDTALRQHSRIHTALFHSDLNLLQRDKNAAWFARQDGARILLCSEIGSEGRNFQFAHHLVLFDLPLNPEKLEQRIGRLDRIGQKELIHIHVPYIQNTPQERLVRWYQEGLNAFKENVPGSFEIYEKLGPELKTAILENAGFDTFIQKTQREAKKTARLVEEGRDRLLEINSFDSGKAQELLQKIQNIDEDRQFDPFVETLFSQFGIQMEEIAARTHHIKFDALNNPLFPVPVHQDENLIATFSRQTAILREDIEFLTWEHPMITTAMDLILGAEKGNCTLAVYPKADADEFLLECIFVLECLAPASLHVQRFLAPTPVRTLVNHQFKDMRELYPYEHLTSHLKGMVSSSLLHNAGIKSLIPRMINRSEELARDTAEGIIQSVLKSTDDHLQWEINRLIYLQKINPAVRHDEITLLEQEKSAVLSAITFSRVRLDALRLIITSKE